MKLISVKEYVDFKCSGGDCPICCCGGKWKIVIDDKTAEFYNSVEGEFGDKLKYGFFAGYSKNLGTKENVVGDFYGRGSNIASIYRIAPKVLYKFAKFDIGSELEITKVWYGIPDNNDNFMFKDGKMDVQKFKALQEDKNNEQTTENTN